MNLQDRPSWKRWASSAVIAAGAITFAATDGFGYTPRLMVLVSSSGTCNAGAPNGYVGTGIAYNSNSQVLCDVNAAAIVGTTNFAESRCPGNPWLGTPVSIKAEGRIINSSTGDWPAPFCDAGGTTAWSGWSSCTGTSGSCTMTVSVHGQ